MSDLKDMNIVLDGFDKVLKRRRTKFPLCREPWESFYILRRGTTPCCFGNEVIAPMSGWKESWNSKGIKKIRKDLKRGKLSKYCLNSPSCPIVQRICAEKPELLSIDDNTDKVLLRLLRKILRILRDPRRLIKKMKSFVLNKKSHE